MAREISSSLGSYKNKMECIRKSYVAEGKLKDLNDEDTIVIEINYN